MVTADRSAERGQDTVDSQLRRKGIEMSDGGKVVVNLATGHEDADRVTVAFLVATAALDKGRAVAMFTSKEAVRLGLPGYAVAIESAGARLAGATPL